jgi:NAD(P)-dependent dehydrogenase (short-subunit alcohol dehydrogenase family)
MSARTFVVAGGTSGLGREIARMLAAEHRVVVLGDVEAEVSEVARELSCDGMVCDVSRHDQLHSCFAAVAARYGTVYGATTCASMWAGGALEDLAPEVVRRAVEVNAIGAANFLREALIGMKEQGHGNIVYVGAVAVDVPRPGIPLYRATKSFGKSLVESLAQELGSNRIKVMQIHPGPMPTRLQERQGGEFLDRIFALPEQVAREVVRLLLLEPDDLYVSGQKVLRADGRW